MNLVLPALLATSPLPSAVPVAPGHGAIYLQPGISLTAFDAQAGVQVGLPARLVVSAGGSFAGPVGGFDAALRWNVVESEHFSFGPWLGYTLTTAGADGASAQGPSVGVAVEGGGDFRHWSVGGGVTLVNLESPGAYVVGGFHW